MQNKTRTRFIITAIMVALSLALVGGRIYWLQVAGRSDVLERGYIDKAELKRMNRLLELGVFRRGPQGEVLIDQKRLVKLEPNTRTRRRFTSLAQAAYLRPGQKQFDPRLFRILPPQRRLAAPMILRGALLDAADKPLAYSTTGRGGAQSRVYPLGAVGMAAIGFYNPIHGSGGLEAELEPILNTPNPALPPVALSGPPYRYRLGCNVRLTLDSRLQRLACEVLEGRRGAAVLLDVKTGAIKAAAGNPALDPNSTDAELWRKARSEDKGSLLLSPAWHRRYPPGSCFKLVLAAAWLEANPGKSPPVITCRGGDAELRINDLRAHGRTGLAKAVIHSCNVYFARLGRKLGPKARQMAEAIGFNRQPDLLPRMRDIRLAAAPSLAYAWLDQPGAKGGGLRIFESFRRDKKIAAQCAIGQNLVQATCLQMAQVAQSIANQGLAQSPYLVSGFQDPADGGWRQPPPPPGHRVMSTANANKLAKMMNAVLTRGTGRRSNRMLAKENRGQVAGKTGTAETGIKGQQAHSWFIGFAPVDKPRYAVAVVIENGGHGSHAAAPAAVRLLAGALAWQLPQKDKERSQ